MKKLIPCLWIIILFLTSLPVHAQDKLTLCSADSPPWTIKNGDSPTDIGGLAVDIMNELSRRSGITVHMEALPFKRCLKYTEHGVFDGCFMTIKNAEREVYAEFTDPYLSIPTYIYYNPDILGRVEWETWADLKPYTIGSQRGFKYGQEFTNAVVEIPLKIIEIQSVKSGLVMLSKGWVDLVLSNEFRFNYLMEKYPEFQGMFSRAEKPIAVGHVYMAVSRKSPHVALVPKLNEVLDKMKSDGTIEKIVHP
ncbi:ABC transporter substrate-binding protein [Desulfovibrio sp. JC010]|uniref:substrate-binding periplasmic protein n=1 Tax=Desulfovibrio sp. JC010 TaxID=2593641 RepID=UPI0013D14050|nr:transporter substrate-binding domain-containing protein [Desulfovibrio sp. JC010]NDV28608.1 amino acid ABC transporter substrate-binding protein [Desulfovibrio sp. JC010]